MIYNFMLKDPVLETTNMINNNINEFNSLLEAGNCLLENNILTEASLKGYLQSFIVKVRQILRNLYDLVCRMIEKSKEKVIKAIVDKNASKLKKWIKDNNLEEKSFPIDIRLYRAEFRFNHLIDKLKDLSDNNIHLSMLSDGSEYDLNESEEFVKGQEEINKLIKHNDMIRIMHNKENTENEFFCFFTETIYSVEDISHKVQSCFGKHIDNIESILEYNAKRIKELEKSLAFIEKHNPEDLVSRTDYVKNLQNTYNNYIKGLNLSNEVCNYIRDILLVGYNRNLDLIKLALTGDI